MFMRHIKEGIDKIKENLDDDEMRELTLNDAYKIINLRENVEQS